MTTQGLTYEQHTIGARYETSRRTVHDADLSTFVNLFGFTEPLFDKHAQWLPGAVAALVKMAQAVLPSGLVVLRDYDHTGVEQPFGPADVVEGHVL